MHHSLTDPIACGHAQCRMCSARASVLFAGVPAPHLAVIEQNIEERTLAPGDSLYRVGDPGAAIFTIREGVLKLVQYLTDGTERIVRLVSSTDVAGLEALLDQPYQHDAVALQTTSVCRIPVEVLRRLQGENPSLHQELMRRWQRALSEADAWLTELSTGPAKRRVARLLLRLVDESGSGRCLLFNRKDMGAMLGVTTESASRVIAEFKRAKLLQESAAGFRVDRPVLQKIAVD